jgi:hypothetical protein
VSDSPVDLYRIANDRHRVISVVRAGITDLAVVIATPASQIMVQVDGARVRVSGTECGDVDKISATTRVEADGRWNAKTTDAADHTIAPSNLTRVVRTPALDDIGGCP